MKLTNKMGLPEPLVNAVKNQAYSPGSSDITVTTLIQPPLIRKLRKEHDSEVEEDVSDRIWALIGSATHGILENAFKGTQARVEERVYAQVLGWKIGGQFDVLEGSTLSDYKITSVYSADGKIEWEQQLNVLRWLLHKNNTLVDKLQIVAIFRDWSKHGIKKNPDYPPSQVSVINIPVWTLEDTEAYIKERVALHQLAEPPMCNDEERWANPEQWALMKKGGKRAIKLYPSQEGVILSPDQYWEHRPATYKRCEDYCSVSKFCPLWNNTTF